MKRLTLLLTCFVISMSLAIAQNTQVKGVVVDEGGEAIIGASVIVKGTTTGTVTDIDGNFSLTVPSTATTLIVKYIGMIDQEVAIAPNVKVVLKPSATALDEVMVVAYGTAKKSSFTGAASTIKGDKIARQQTSNVSKSLEGAVAGVQITSNSGQPGSSANIRIRGIGSISASSNPLIVVDGVPYEGSLNSINNQDIESMSVLKDAAANSLYGARGANGVIMITTKKGKSGRTTVSYENRTGFNDLGVKPYDILTSPQEYYELYWEALRNQQVYGGSGTNPIAAGQYATNNLIPALGNYNNYDVADNQLVDPATGKLNPNANLMYHDNWFDEAFRPGLREENNISLNGGTEKTKFYASVNYLYDDSYTDQSTLKRISSRLNLDQEVNSWFKAGFNMAFANVETDAPNVGGSNYSSIFFTGQLLAPIYPVYLYNKEGNRILDKDGNPLYDYGTVMGKRPVGANTNAIAQQKLDIRKTTVDVVNAKAYVDFKFLKDFTLTLNASIDNFNTSSINFQTPVDGDAKNVGGRSTKEMARYYVLNANQLLSWGHDFDGNKFDVLLGHEIKKDRVSELWAQKENFVVPDNPELANGGKLKDASSSASEYALEGMFGQIKYEREDKYYLSTSFRRDASSRFSKETRWGSFWSAGAAWRIKQESFLSDKEWLDDLKIKASYGTQGNDNIGNNQGYTDQYEIVNQDGVPGTNYIFRGNPALTWEKSKNFNAGFDFKIYNKLAGSLDYFRKETTDLLYMKPLAPSEGRPSSIWENTMSMVNNGIEIELVYDIINTNDLKWNISVNATHYSNKITELPPDRSQDGWAVSNYYYKIGNSIYDWYLYKYEGIDPANGSPLFLADVMDAQGNITGKKTVSTTAEATRYEIGKTSIPDVYGGFSTYVDFKGFDFSVAVAYEIGGYSYDSQYATFMNGGTAGNNWHKDIYQRWTPDHTDTTIPRLQVGYQDINGTSDRFLTSRTHLSLKNMTLGYSLPMSTLSKIGIEKLRFFVVGDNIWLFSKRQGFDPRQSFGGSTAYVYSAMRTLSVGLNLNF